MYQELLRFHIPFLNGTHPIYGYGVMLVLGFLLSTQLAKYLARRHLPKTVKGDPGDLFVNAALIGLVAGILGARLSHVLENIHDFTRSDRSAWDNFFSMIDLSSGGLTYYGGFLLAFPILVWYALRKKIPLRLGMDIIAPSLMVALGFGRIGCFLNGCCYGATCDANAWYAVQFPYGSPPVQEELRDIPVKLSPDVKEKILPPDARRELVRDGEFVDAYTARHDADLKKFVAEVKSLPLHPAQLYSAFNAFLLAGLLTAYFTIPHATGRVFALMMIFEGATRFLLEMLRAEPAVTWLRWAPYPFKDYSLSMILGLLLVAMGITLWFAFGPREAQPRPRRHRSGLMDRSRFTSDHKHRPRDCPTLWRTTPPAPPATATVPRLPRHLQKSRPPVPAAPRACSQEAQSAPRQTSPSPQTPVKLSISRQDQQRSYCHYPPPPFHTSMCL